jgi:L-alanine-DL-glutamate epimerase-like enolase superfamily enzyme
MKIINIKIQLKQIALKTPFITALRKVEYIEFVRVFIESDNGFVGIGEAPATKAITGEGIKEIVESIEDIKSTLVFLYVQDALTQLHLARHIGSSAKAAIDMALVTLISQAKGIPLYKYLGANNLSKIKTDITISLNNADLMLRDSIKAFDNGFDILKLKFAEDISHAIEVTKLISKNLQDCKILIDANQAWSVEDSLKFINATKGIEIELIEQPVIASDIDGLRFVTKNSNIPILADESVFTLEDAKKVIESKSADMINIKLMKCAGITKGVEILEYARAKGIKCMLGSMLEGPYSINAALHLAIAYKDIIKYLDLDSPFLYKKLPDVFEGSIIEDVIYFKDKVVLS